MAKPKGQRGRVGTLSIGEKAAIAAECDRIIITLFKPRYLPEIRPTSFNYPVDIFGQWWRLHAAVTLDEALHLIETQGLLHPQ